MAGAGNSSEFSAMAFSHLVDNTKNQWVYFCNLIPRESFDHSITLTSSIELQVGMIPNKDLDKITVVDGWNHYTICNLQTFCNSPHPCTNENKEKDYLKLVPDKNLKIVAKLKSSPKTSLDKDKKEYIGDWYNDYFPKANINLPTMELNKLFTEQRDKIYGDEKPIPRILNDLRTDEEKFDDLDLDDADSNYMPIITTLLSNHKQIMVANKLKQLKPKTLEIALNLIKNFVLFKGQYTTELMHSMEDAFLDKIDEDMVATLFANYPLGIGRKGAYIQYLWGYGLSPNKTRIRKILVLNKAWANMYVKRLPKSGITCFTQTRAINLINIDNFIQ